MDPVLKPANKTIEAIVPVKLGQHNAVSRLFKTFVYNTTCIVLAGGLLSGCSITNATQSLGTDTSVITSSIEQPVATEGVADTDAEFIKQAVAQTNEAVSQSNLLAWSNPETGNQGTITAIDDFFGKDGQSCKKFRTTIDSFMGISLYNGETCELKKGFWVLSWFIRDIAK